MKLNDADLTHWRTMSFAMFALAALGIELVPLLDPEMVFEPSWILHAAAAVCLATAFGFRQVPMGQMRTVGRVVLLIGVVVITALIATSSPVTWFAIFYFWPLLAAAYVYSRYEFAALVVVTLAVYGAALAVNSERFGGGYPLLPYLMFVLGLSTVMVAVRLLREGIDELMMRLEVISSTDALTGLANRRIFEREFALASERATKHGRPLSVLLFDLDHFKAINDTYGHPEGDNVLRHFATLLAQASREGDLPARIGGEEFALIMPNTSSVDASAFASRFSAVLRADNQAQPDRPAVTVSTGVAELSPAIPCSDTLFVEADRALYEAKRSGRDRVVVAPGRRAEDAEPVNTGASARPAD